MIDVTIHHKDLLNYAKLLRTRHTDPEDLVQETYIRAMNNIHTFAPGTNLLAWMKIILKNVAINIYRKTTRFPDTEATRLFTVADSKQNTPLHILSDRCISTELINEYNKLHPLWKKLVDLRVQGLAYHEIAQILKIPQGTIMSGLSRTRARFRKLERIT